jgi:Adenylyl cyclase N-terminal extracellular and transmembrane region
MNQFCDLFEGEITHAIDLRRTHTTGTRAALCRVLKFCFLVCALDTIINMFGVLDMFQLTANTMVFLCVNIVGIFVHNLMEHAQRKVFLDTRNCIAARLEMEDENEKLVSSTFLICLLLFLQVIQNFVIYDIL